MAQSATAKDDVTEDNNEGICKILRVGFKKIYGNVTFRELAGIDCNGAVLFEFVRL